MFGLKKYNFTRIITNILASLFVTLLATASTLTGLSLLPDKIIIGAIMPLVPGIAFTTSIRDIYKRGLSVRYDTSARCTDYSRVCCCGSMSAVLL